RSICPRSVVGDVPVSYSGERGSIPCEGTIRGVGRAVEVLVLQIRKTGSTPQWSNFNVPGRPTGEAAVLQTATAEFDSLTRYLSLPRTKRLESPVLQIGHERVRDPPASPSSHRWPSGEASPF